MTLVSRAFESVQSLSQALNIQHAPAEASERFAAREAERGRNTTAAVFGGYR